MRSINFYAAKQPSITGETTNARVAILTFIILLMLVPPLVVQANAIFDSQIKLAKQGNAEAQFKVGEMYEAGFV